MRELKEGKRRKILRENKLKWRKMKEEKGKEVV